MKPNIDYKWDDKTKTAYCYINVDNNIFTGVAKCNPTDLDFANKNTGLEIATRKANLKVLHNEKKKVKIQFDTMNHFMSLIQQSPKCDTNSYLYKKSLRYWKTLKEDYDMVNDLIQISEESLATYISNKDNFYKKVRANRANKKDELN